MRLHLVFIKPSRNLHTGLVLCETGYGFRLLEALAGDPGRAFTRLELLGRVFGRHDEGLERTVDTHVRNLRKKIERDPKEPTYVETVYGVRYRFGGVERDV